MISPAPCHATLRPAERRRTVSAHTHNRIRVEEGREALLRWHHLWGMQRGLPSAML